MFESVLEDIKRNKIENNALLDFLFFDFQDFTYCGKKYVNVYFYSRERIDEVELNNVKPIYTSMDITKISETAIRDNRDTFFGCYEKDKLKGQLKVTAYTVKTKRTVVDNYIKLDCDIFNNNKNSIEMLKYLAVFNDENLVCLPKVNKDYYICACGRINNIDNKECKQCTTKLELLKKYSDDEKIEKAYVEKRFDNYKFKTNEKKEEIEIFKNEVFTDDIKLNKKYITNEFIKSLFEDIDNKLKDYDERKKKKQKVFKTALIIAAVIVVLLIGYGLYENNNHMNYIKKYCDSTDYSYYENVDELIKNATCPNIVEYLKNNEYLSKEEANKLIESNNRVIYETFKKVKGKELYIYLDDPDYYNVDNKEYISYLVENNINIEDKWISRTMRNSIEKDDKKLFELTSKLYKEEKWSDASYYLNLKNYLKRSGYEISEFSLIYHKNSNDNTCYDADLLSVDNIKYLFEKDENACLNANYYYSYERLGNYMKATGKIGKCDLEKIVKSWYFNYDSKDRYNVLESYLKQYKNSGCDINKGSTTPLDLFMEAKTSSTSSTYNFIECEIYKNNKTCKNLKTYYKLLKKYGAKCKYNCDVEKYFK